MAKIGDDRMIVRSERRGDGSRLLTVCYTACFTGAEIGQRFDDSVQILGGDLPGRSAIGEQPVAFTASGQRVFRKKRMVLPAGYQVSDAMSVWIRLQRNGTEGPVADARCGSPIGGARASA